MKTVRTFSLLYSAGYWCKAKNKPVWFVFCSDSLADAPQILYTCFHRYFCALVPDAVRDQTPEKHVPVHLQNNHDCIPGSNFLCLPSSALNFGASSSLKTWAASTARF